MALSDEINSCSYNDGAGTRLRGRPQTFCDAVIISSTLNVKDDATFDTNVGVTGRMTSGEVYTLAAVVGSPIPAPPNSSSNRPTRRLAKKAASTANDLTVSGVVHAGDELRLGSGYYVSFKKNSSMAQVTNYTLPTAYPAVSGQFLSSTPSGEMEWIGGSNPGVSQDYGYIYNPAPAGYDYGTI